MATVLRGQLVGLRERRPADVPVLHAELYDDVDHRSRTDPLPWRPLAADSPESPFALRPPRDDVVAFSVVRLADDELVGGAVLWGVDTHDRAAHVGLSLRPAFRGQGLGTDVVRVLCDLAFRTRGLQRVQIETLADNLAMLRSAERVGFTHEGTLRRAAWVQGRFLDLELLGLLADEWQRPLTRR